MTTRTNQPTVPHGLGRGDRVIWMHGVDNPEERSGVVVDILSTQFLIEDDDYNNYVVPFRDVSPLLRKAIP